MTRVIVPGIDENGDPRPLNAHHRNRIVFETEGETLTEQEAKKQCDVNRILERYQRTGAIDHGRQYQGTYGDVTGVSFSQAQNLVARMKTEFENLPSSLRDRFNNDPALYLDFVADPANNDEMVELGLIPPPEEEGPPGPPEAAREPEGDPPADPAVEAEPSQ